MDRQPVVQVARQQLMTVVVAAMELHRKDTAALLATAVPVVPPVAMAAVVDRLVATAARLAALTAAMAAAVALVAEAVAAALVTVAVVAAVSAAAVVVLEIEVKTVECVQ